MTRSPGWMRGAAVMEFALAWPVTLLLVLGCVELAVWEAEAFAARSAALAGARAATVAGAGPGAAAAAALYALAPSLVGAAAVIWCPGQPAAPAGVWVCATDLGSAVQVEVGGSVPALVPLVPGGGLPLHAYAVLQKETFAR
ncbi:hypothetical protein EPN29_10245 [bacterium]|nr:MAG: hypothetical protein EPN29_10245 [bacterium]